MCPADIEEIVADIFAIFLLIPVRYFFVEFLEYVKCRMGEGKIPVTTESWIRYLAEISMIPDYYVAYGYQQLRYVAYWIYQAWNDKYFAACIFWLAHIYPPALHTCFLVVPHTWACLIFCS